MAVLLYSRCRVAGVADQYFLRTDDYFHGVFEGFDIKFALRCPELHQVQTGKVTSRVVEEHVLGAWIGRVDPTGHRAGMPLVNRGIELNAWIAANMGRLGHLAHQIPRFVNIRYLTVRNVTGIPLSIFLHGLHELVCYPDAMVRVLEEYRPVRFSIHRPIIARVYERPRLLLLVRLGPDELDNIRMVNVQNHHLGRPPGPPT